jgi:hypothetical protein
MLGVAAVAFLALLLAALRIAQPSTTFSIGVTPFQAGHYQNYYSDHFVVLFVTNNTVHPLLLTGGVLQLSHPNGTLLHDFNVQWKGKEGQIIALPHEAIPVPLSVGRQFVKYRLTFEYSGDAGRLRSFLSRGVRRLPQKILSAKTVAWLQEHGWMDGRMHGKYEAP